MDFLIGSFHLLSQVREAFNPYSVLELTAGDIGEVSCASTFGFWILVIRREIVMIRSEIVMIRREIVMIRSEIVMIRRETVMIGVR